MRVTGSAISRELRVGPVLGDDERAAVGGVAALLGGVVHGFRVSWPAFAPARYGDRRGAGAEAEVGEPEHDEPDQRRGRRSGRE